MEGQFYFEIDEPSLALSGKFLVGIQVGDSLNLYTSWVPDKYHMTSEDVRD